MSASTHMNFHKVYITNLVTGLLGHNGELVGFIIDSGDMHQAKKPEPIFLEPYLIEGSDQEYLIPYNDAKRIFGQIVIRALNRRLQRSAQEGLAYLRKMEERSRDQ